MQPNPRDANAPTNRGVAAQLGGECEADSNTPLTRWQPMPAHDRLPLNLPLPKALGLAIHHAAVAEQALRMFITGERYSPSALEIVTYSIERLRQIAEVFHARR